jgi:recombination protein RecA
MPKLDDIIKEMNKKNKEDIVTLGLPTYSCTKIPFTSPRMNYCTFGGIPTGKIIEFFGEEHGGKTTTALDIIANYQQMEDARKVLYVDAENTLDVEWAKKLGVDVDSMITFKPTTQSAEEIFQFIYDVVESGEVGLWVLDSIPALSSLQELEKSMEEKTYAGISGPLSTFSRKIEKVMARHNCTGIGINQLRDDLGAMWGGAVKTPGGRAWKHFCSVRLQFSKGKYIDENGNDLNSKAECPAGNYVLMSMLKNKCCPPTRRTGFYTLNYEYGVDYLKDLVEVAIKYSVVQKTGAWFSIVNPETGELITKLQGQANVYKYLENEDNEDVLAMIEEHIDSLITMN